MVAEEVRGGAEAAVVVVLGPCWREGGLRMRGAQGVMRPWVARALGLLIREWVWVGS
jgi:hypothetical protein